MKRLLTALFAIFIVAFSFGQPKDYVTWTYSQKKISAGEYELSFKAKVEPKWHLYSQIKTVDKDGDGPSPLEFVFKKSKDYQLVGKTIEPKPIEQAEPMYDGMVLKFFANTATFTQRIKVLSDKPVTVKGTIYGQACNESQCQQFSPPPIFAFSLEAAPQSEVTAINESDSTSIVAKQTDVIKDDSVSESKTQIVDVPETTVTEGSEPAPTSERSYLGLFIAGFLGGLLALLTPCVFPMIPMTVSFFTKQSKTKAEGIRNAFIYSISIIAIYVALGLGITLIFGADALNYLSTNPWFNIAFFILLVVFAISFLGAFEITLPSGFVNKMDAKSDKGGLIGIFFMAFTLGLVSFSCTGPIIGNLLVIAASTGALAGPFFGMFGFSLALALPFGLFAAFPGWLNSLPKSGGWLNSVKVVLGFLELALAMKFLSNADLVYDAMIITREVFLISWIVIFALLGAYLMSWFKLSHDSDVKHVSVGRLMMAIFAFGFTIYLIPGLWGAPLKMIGAFPPPLGYNESNSNSWFQAKNSGGTTTQTATLPEHMHLGPHDIPAFDDYYHALAYSKKVNKPLMIDFTGKACVNCRKMEAEVWSNPEVKRKLAEDFVLVSLYVDKKNELPAELQVEVDWNGSKRTLSDIGSRWSHLQNTRYLSSTQPQYWIIDGDEKHFSDSTSYDPDVAKYIKWLDKGLARFHKK